MNPQLMIVGLSGGIASGKSTVSNYMRTHGVQVIDLDKVGKEVVKPGTWCYRQVVSSFGKDFVDSSGNIDRKKLGDLIFNDGQARKKLNSIVHPWIAWSLFKQLLWHCNIITGTKHLVLDSPLLIESGLYRICSVVVIVSIPVDIQIQRLKKRDNISEEDAKARIASQLPIEKKLQYADYELQNTGSLSELEDKVKDLMKTLEKRRTSINSRLIFSLLFYSIGIATFIWYIYK